MRVKVSGHVVGLRKAYRECSLFTILTDLLSVEYVCETFEKHDENPRVAQTFLVQPHSKLEMKGIELCLFWGKNTLHA